MREREPAHKLGQLPRSLQATGGRRDSLQLGAQETQFGERAPAMAA